jgi:hypothetical protein
MCLGIPWGSTWQPLFALQANERKKGQKKSGGAGVWLPPKMEMALWEGQKNLKGAENPGVGI